MKTFEVFFTYRMHKKENEAAILVECPTEAEAAMAASFYCRMVYDRNAHVKEIKERININK